MENINILFPVYNEEKRLVKGIESTINYLESIKYKSYQITIIDNASVDKTQKLAYELIEKHENIDYIHIDEKGVGVAFRKGVKNNSCDIVGYMDIDLSTDINHLSTVIDLFRNDLSIDMINGSRLNKNSKTIGRKWYRNITSIGLTLLLKLTLKMKATDSICGFKFFKKQSIEKLINIAGCNEDGWFYIIELLLRAEKSGMNIVELPVVWKDDYNTTVHVGKLIRNYCIGILNLRKRMKAEQRGI